MNEDPLQEALADEGAFTGETDESELQALVSRLKTNSQTVERKVRGA